MPANSDDTDLEPFAHIFAQAHEHDLLLAAFYQLDDGTYRAKWRRKNGAAYDFSEPQMSRDPREALVNALMVAVNTLPPVRRPERRRVV